MAKKEKKKKKKKTALVICRDRREFWTTQKQFWQWVREGVIDKTGDQPLTGAFRREHDELMVLVMVYEVKPDRRKSIPAVTHVDGSGRLQTVTRQANPRYYDLIEQLYQLTGVPVVLNTSFNENEPIVCT